MNTSQQSNISLFHRLSEENNNFKIATHNVRNCISNEKRNQIEQFFSLHNFNILGLSETHLTMQQSYSICNKFKSPDLPYKYFLLNENHSQNCQGVSFIVKSSISKYIFNYQGFFDRIIFLNLQMKNRQKLRIIQIYFPTNTYTAPDHQYKLKMQQKILDLIIEAKSKNYYHIIMED